MHELLNANSDAADAVVRAAPDARFAMLEGQPALFCESAQSLYALNPVAAAIWCSIEAGGGIEEAKVGLVEAGVGAGDARRHVDDAVARWLKLGLLRADFGPAQERHTCGFRAGDIDWGIETASRTLSRQIAGLFDSDPADERQAAGARLKAVEFGGEYHVYCDDRTAFVCSADELAPSAKAAITERLLAARPGDLAFHAACVSRNSRNILISGAPGAGKTTIALHLAARGFLYGGDDIAFISPDGCALGVACAPTVKSGAWEIVAALRPDLLDKPIHRRLDGKLVRYLEPGARDQKPAPVEALIFVRQVPGARAGVEPIGAVDALRRVIEGSLSPGGRLTVAGFAALRRLLEGAQAYDLTFESSHEAADLIAGLVHVGA